jgi:guanine deaminase
MELFRAAIFHTPDNPFLADARALVHHADGGLLVDHGRVIACGDYQQIRRESASAQTIDWRGGVILPGLIDAHVHYPQVRLIGALGRSLLDWLDAVALPEEARMADQAYASASARLFLRALASHGTTTALVFGAHFPAAMTAFFDAASVSGLRIVSGLVVSDRLLRPELHTSPDRAYRESSILIGRYHGRGRLGYAVTPRFAYSTTEAMLEVCRQLMTEHDDVLLHTHINESPQEVAELKRLFTGAADYLSVYERFGLIGPRAVMAHNVHATSSEIQRLAVSRTAVAHCPGSNAALGSGCFPMRRHVAAGVTCALGTDVGGGLGFGMLKEGLHAYLMQRLAPDPVVLHPAHLLYLATRAGADALRLGDEVGDFQPGKAGDFVHFRPPEGSVLEAAIARAETPEDALGALFTIGGPESVREVRVGGDVVFSTA